jgi:Domain of Unknown Function (DUF928)
MVKTDRVLTGWSKSFWGVIFVLLTFHSQDFLNQDRVAFAQIPKLTQKPAPAKSRNPPIIDWIVKLLKPKRRGGSRGDEMICAESPTFRANYPYLWTRQPLLVWSGSPSSLQLLDAQSLKIVWQKTIDSNSEIRQIRIDRPLELGKRYIWRVVAKPGNDAVNPEIAFQMLDANQWKKIDRELTALEQKLKGQKLSSEEITLEKVSYFAQRQMWGDAQETLAFLPANLSQRLAIIIQDELNECRYIPK